MKFKIILLYAIILFFSCKNENKSYKNSLDKIEINSPVKHDCDDIPQMFTNFAEAQKFVRGLDWTYSDDATFEGSWINSAEYYSCDRKTGFFIMCTDGKCYIHDYVEKDLWEGFKGTLKPGSYYHKYMKDKYQMYDRVEQR